jgi:hypothetical protein
VRWRGSETNRARRRAIVLYKERRQACFCLRTKRKMAPDHAARSIARKGLRVTG